jgi:hypothetical protein
LVALAARSGPPRRCAGKEREQERRIVRRVRRFINYLV